MDTNNEQTLPLDIEEVLEKIVGKMLLLNTKEPVEYMKITCQLFHDAFPGGLIPLQKRISLGIIKEIFSVAYFQLSEYNEGSLSFEEFTPFLDLFFLLFTICPEYIPRTFALRLPAVLNGVLREHISDVSPENYSRFLHVFSSLCGTRELATRMVNEFHIDRHIAYSTLGLLLQPVPPLASIVEALRLVVQVYAMTRARQITGAQAAGLFEHIFSFEAVRAFDCFEDLVSVLFEFLSSVGIDSIPPPICDVLKTLAKSSSSALRLRVFLCVANLRSPSLSLFSEGIFEDVLDFLRSADNETSAEIFAALAMARYTSETSTRTQVFDELYLFVSSAIPSSTAAQLKSFCDFLRSLFSPGPIEQRILPETPAEEFVAPDSSTLDSDIPSEELLGFNAFDDRAEMYIEPETEPASVIQHSRRASSSGMSFSNTSTSLRTYFSQVSDFSMSFRHLLTAQRLTSPPPDAVFNTPTAAKPLVSDAELQTLHQRCNSDPIKLECRFSPRISVIGTPLNSPQAARGHEAATVANPMASSFTVVNSSQSACSQFSMTGSLDPTKSPPHKLFAETIPALSREIIELNSTRQEIINPILVPPIFARIRELGLSLKHPAYSSFLSFVTEIIKQSEELAATDIPELAASIVHAQIATGDIDNVSIHSIDFVSAALLLPEADKRFMNEEPLLISSDFIRLVSSSPFLLSELFRGLETAVAMNTNISMKFLTHEIILLFFDVPNIPQNGKMFLHSLLRLKGIAPYLVREDLVKRFLLGEHNLKMVEQFEKEAEKRRAGEGGGEGTKRAELAEQIDEQVLLEYFQFILSSSCQPAGALPAASDELVLSGLRTSFGLTHSAPSILMQIVLHENTQKHTLPKMSSVILKQFSIIPSLHTKLIDSGVVTAAAAYLVPRHGSVTVKTNILEAFLNIVRTNPKLFCANFRNAPEIFIRTLAQAKRPYYEPALGALYELTFVRKQLSVISEQVNVIINSLEKRRDIDIWSEARRHVFLALLHRIICAPSMSKKGLQRMEKQNHVLLLLSFPLSKKSPPDDVRLFFEVCRLFIPIAPKIILHKRSVLSKLYKLLVREVKLKAESVHRSALIEFLSDAFAEDASLTHKQLLHIDPASPTNLAKALSALAAQSSDTTYSHILQILDKLTHSRSMRGDSMQTIIARAFATMRESPELLEPRTRKAEKNLRNRFDLKELK
eukprot:gnl/Chilomastix_cuspidata/1408.p1 GENE.gnl/Chilomastix_cuspidata/1408~~gnl/Chilomastix_cuspidata/1408.p1  ORF type:complete len:1205 (-),score=297.47 gnl/Chilomastix_cuspidata/1408:1763-5341(-)